MFEVLSIFTTRASMFLIYEYDTDALHKRDVQSCRMGMQVLVLFGRKLAHNLLRYGAKLYAVVLGAVFVFEDESGDLTAL